LDNLVPVSHGYRLYPPPVCGHSTHVSPRLSLRVGAGVLPYHSLPVQLRLRYRGRCIQAFTTKVVSAPIYQTSFGSLLIAEASLSRASFLMAMATLFQVRGGADTFDAELYKGISSIGFDPSLPPEERSFPNKTPNPFPLLNRGVAPWAGMYRGGLIAACINPSPRSPLSEDDGGASEPTRFHSLTGDLSPVHMLSHFYAYTES
ncbi:hypothetical protein KIPB_015187, partial [Kipferlia bialata]